MVPYYLIATYIVVAYILFKCPDLDLEHDLEKLGNALVSYTCSKDPIVIAPSILPINFVIQFCVKI